MANIVLLAAAAVLSTRQLILAVNSHFARATSLPRTHGALSCTQTQRTIPVANKCFRRSALCTSGVMANESGRKAKYKYTHARTPSSGLCLRSGAMFYSDARVALRFY
jgi:hypothetical protein